MRYSIVQIIAVICNAICFLLPLQLFSQEPSAKRNKADEPSGNITFMTTRDGPFELYTMNAKGEMVTNLSNNKTADYWASYPSDAKVVYFYSKRDGNEEVYRMDHDGANQVNISSHPANDRFPSVSPDGKKIVFMSDRDDLQGEMYLMSADGHGVRRLTFNAVGEDAARWSPDGKYILFGKDARNPLDSTSKDPEDFEIFRILVDGTNETRLTHMPGFCAGPAISPDGKRIAFYGRTENGFLDIYTMNVNGSGLKNITMDSTENYSPHWSPDGKWIAYTAGDMKNYDIWILNPKTKEKRRLTSHPKRDETPVWID